MSQNPFARAVMQPTPDAVTENGLPAFSSTSNPLVDLYFQAVRNIDEHRLAALLNNAWAYDALATLRLIFQMRDCRGGKGDRRTFHLAFTWLTTNHLQVAVKNIKLLPEYGYWKDVVSLFSSSSIGVSNAAVNLYTHALQIEKDRLAFKYAPRPGKSLKVEAKILRHALGMNEKEYRKFLKEGTEVVEQLMCEHEVVEGKGQYDVASGRMLPSREVVLTGWSKINYPSVPSVAMKRYTTSKKKQGYVPSFARHDAERFSAFLESVQKGEVRIKAGQLYPYELTKQYTSSYNPSQNAVVDAQWAELVRITKEAGFLGKAIPAVDVSGSMCTNVAEGVQAIDISKSLGLLISEVTHEAWRNIMISFSDNPMFYECKGTTLYDRCKELKKFEQYEGYSTNFLAVFRQILARAKKFNLTQEDMPEMVIALSDCQFNNDSYMGRESAVDIIKKEYAAASYKPPVLIFWNLNGRYNNFPSASEEPGVIMLSGFSPSALQMLLTSGEINPARVVEELVNSERYAAVTL